MCRVGRNPRLKEMSGAEALPVCYYSQDSVFSAVMV